MMMRSRKRLPVRVNCGTRKSMLDGKAGHQTTDLYKRNGEVYFDAFRSNSRVQFRWYIKTEHGWTRAPHIGYHRTPSGEL